MQEAVLAAELGRDLRISSQTGSGKTIAIGFVIRHGLLANDKVNNHTDDRPKNNDAYPHALVITPTRELAKQVEEELSWFFAPLDVRVASVTGGGGYRDELRAFRTKPAIIVGTPGRLLDHLKRGAINAADAQVFVFDEADRMLDLGFREDLEAILGYAPEGHRTHLVSATFPREVKALADRVQKNPLPIEGTPLGTANLDIEHIVHIVHPRERLNAVINLLLDDPRVDERGAEEPLARMQSLVFARTRANVAELAESLAEAGFAVAMLSGEMEQPERNRALAAFKRGSVDALVATDVAARGIDVVGVTRVIHGEPPDDADAYTHRSGRTGRAGKKGTSSALVTMSELPRMSAMLSRARVRYRLAPLPTAESIRESRDTSMVSALTANFVEGDTVDPRSFNLAERILASSEPTRAVARLVAMAQRRTTVEPRDITRIEPPSSARGPGASRRSETMGPGRDQPREDRPRQDRPRDDRPREDRPREDRPRQDRPREDRPRQDRPREDRPRQDRPRETRASSAAPAWVSFRVSWGEAHGADARRLVAMMCRRGNVEGRDIGAIRVGRTSSVIDVTEAVAAEFEKSTAKPDPRDPRVHVRRWVDEVSHDQTKPKREATTSDAPPPPPPPVRERPSRSAVKEEEAMATLPPDRPSRRAARAEAPPDRPSRRAAPKDRPSVPKDRPSVPKDRPSVPKAEKSAPADRPSSRRVVKEIPADRSSRNVGKEDVVAERPSRRVVREAPADRPSRKTPPKEVPPQEQPRAAKSPPRVEHAKKRPWQKKRPKWQGSGGNAPPKRRP